MQEQIKCIVEVYVKTNVGNLFRSDFTIKTDVYAQHCQTSFCLQYFVCLCLFVYFVDKNS